MKRPFLALAAALVIAAPAAQAFRAYNTLEVQPVDEANFEVIGRPGVSGAADFWCGAGDYALAQLRTGATQRVYLTGAIGPSTVRPGRKAVRFSLQPPPSGAIAPGYSLSVRAVGDNMTAAAAQQFCWGRRILDF